MPDQSPAYRYVVTQATTPAGTAKASPLKTALDLGDVTVAAVQILIPDGHAGQTGVAVVYDGQGIAPWAQPPAFLIGNGEQPTFEVDFHFGHPGQIWTYNTGIYDHTHYFRFKVRDATLDFGAGGPQLGFITPAAVIEAAASTTVVAPPTPDLVGVGE